MGSLMHYDDILSMREMVICDAQLVMDELILDRFAEGNLRHDIRVFIIEQGNSLINK